MPKVEIPDLQGQDVTHTLQGLGLDGLSVRQGKRFEITVDGELTSGRLDEVREAAERVLANVSTEAYDIRVLP
jgi:phosphoribosylformylglycinamidine (FGAM) synthase PurS component